MRRREPVSNLSRRRTLTIIGGAAALPLVASAERLIGGSGLGAWEWQGRVLGAEASLVLTGSDAAAAHQAVALCLDEIARLEHAFSLFRPESEIVRLNRDGRLEAATLDMRRLLAEAIRFGALTNGAFDITVQPLWRLYADHFRHQPHSMFGPPRRLIENARRLVDYHAIDLTAGHVRLAQPSMAMTLNGIAQGYITDRIADILRDLGFAQVLVQLGETRALGAPGRDRPWCLGLPALSEAGSHPLRIDLADQAVAVSSGEAARFEPSGRHHHLLDPATGRSSRRYRHVVVVAESAMVADALSTGLASQSLDAARTTIAEATNSATGPVTALLEMTDGHRLSIGKTKLVAG